MNDTPRGPLCPPHPDHVCNDICTWPPFTPEQKERLALLLRPGVIAMHKAKREREAKAKQEAKRDAKHAALGEPDDQ